MERERGSEGVSLEKDGGAQRERDGESVLGEQEREGEERQREIGERGRKSVERQRGRVRNR